MKQSYCFVKAARYKHKRLKLRPGRAAGISLGCVVHPSKQKSTQWICLPFAPRPLLPRGLYPKTVTRETGTYYYYLEVA